MSFREISFSQFLKEITFTASTEVNPFTFLVGSGISQSAGIPTGKEIISKLRKLAKLKCDIHNFNKVVRKENGKYTDEYEAIFTDYFFSYSRRQEILRRFVSVSKFNKSNFFLAKILTETNLSNTVITTNFDDLLYKIVSKIETNHLVIESLEFLPFKLKFRNLLLDNTTSLIYLHGIYTNYFMRNSESEIQNFPSNSRVILQNILSSKGTIVIGYNFYAWDDIVKASFEATKSSGSIPHNIYIVSYNKYSSEEIKNNLKNSAISSEVVFVKSDNGNSLSSDYVLEEIYKYYQSKVNISLVSLTESLNYEDFLIHSIREISDFLNTANFILYCYHKYLENLDNNEILFSLEPDLKAFLNILNEKLRKRFNLPEDFCKADVNSTLKNLEIVNVNINEKSDLKLFIAYLVIIASIYIKFLSSIKEINECNRETLKDFLVFIFKAYIKFLKVLRNKFCFEYHSDSTYIFKINYKKFKSNLIKLYGFTAMYLSLLMKFVDNLNIKIKSESFFIKSKICSQALKVFPALSSNVFIMRLVSNLPTFIDEIRYYYKFLTWPYTEPLELSNFIVNFTRRSSDEEIH